MSTCKDCGKSISKKAVRCHPCHAHSQRTDQSIDGQRICPLCGERKPLSDFPLKGETRHGDRRYGYCKPCHYTYQREKKLANIFGITEDDYNRIVSYQNGLCAICRRPPKSQRLAVDHEHSTGLVRGALCWSCNRSLGFWKEDLVRLQRAIDYLVAPPAVDALGREVYGQSGRSDKKRPRRKRKSAR